MDPKQEVPEKLTGKGSRPGRNRFEVVGAEKLLRFLNLVRAKRGENFEILVCAKRGEKFEILLKYLALGT